VTTPSMITNELTYSEPNDVSHTQATVSRPRGGRVMMSIRVISYSPLGKSSLRLLLLLFGQTPLHVDVVYNITHEYDIQQIMPRTKVLYSMLYSKLV